MNEPWLIYVCPEHGPRNPTALGCCPVCGEDMEAVNVIRANRVRFLPDAPLSDATELAFIDGRTFVNAAKHEQVVTRHVTEVDQLRAGISWARGMCSDGASLQRIDHFLGCVLSEPGPVRIAPATSDENREGH